MKNLLICLLLIASILNAKEYRNLLNTDPTKLVVIDKGKIFYNGEELVLNGECPIEQWKSVLGEHDKITIFDKSTYAESFFWTKFGMTLHCSWHKKNAKKTHIRNIVAKLTYRSDEAPLYSGFLIFDGVKIDENTSYDEYKKRRNHQKFLFYKPSIRKLKPEEHIRAYKGYTICEPYPLNIDLYWEGNRANKHYRKLTIIYITDDVSRYRYEKCFDNPYSHFESPKCDKECAEKKGRAAMALVSALAPHSSGIELPNNDKSEKQESDSTIHRWLSKAKRWAGIKEKVKETLPPSRSEQLQTLYDDIIQDSTLNEDEKMKKLYKAFLDVKVP